MTPADSPLAALRRTPPLPAAQFLAAHPGCWIQYFDDTPARDASKALAARRYDPATALRKQEDRCAVCYSLQAFEFSRTKEGLLCFRNLGVDVDLVTAGEKGVVDESEVERRKEEYLASCLLLFPLRPHWLTETRHGFHAVFRVMPRRDAVGVREGQALNRRLVRALRGDENAALLTQVLRVPGTFQFKDPARPFLCRLLMNNDTLDLYDLDAVRQVLDAPGPFHTPEHTTGAVATPPAVADRPGGRDYLRGVPEGGRNAAAAAVVGGILARLPEDYWEVAGWGGLKEWNRRNAIPLAERELRSVYESIARRERNRRAADRVNANRANRKQTVRVNIDIRNSDSPPLS